MSDLHAAPWEDVAPDAPDHVAGGHSDGPELTEEELLDLLAAAEPGPPSPDAHGPTGLPGTTVAVTEDWLLAPPDRTRELTDALRVLLLARVRKIAAEAAAARVTAGKRPASSDLLAEAQALARVHALTADLAALFADVRREAAELLGEAVQDHLGRKSTKVGTPDGGLVAITVSAASSSLSVDEDALLDILGTALLAGVGNGPDVYASEYTDPTYAAGVRDGIGALREVLGASPGFTKSKLDAVVRRLEQSGEGALAARLGESYARVERGEPTAKLEWTPGDGA